MNYIKLSEKNLKHTLKGKYSVTLGLIVSYLITGFILDIDVHAKDLRSRKKENNTISIHNGGPSLSESANGTDVININNPNINGVSHNKFIDLSVGYGNGLIFNNSTSHGVSQIGGYITKNQNLSQSASVILNEVTGNNISSINGDIEIFGNRADFFLANENGINLNGATFINTSGVTLTTGRPTIQGNSINFDVEKGNVNLNGVGTSGNYFNVLAKTIEIHNQIAPITGESNPNINIVAGENIAQVNRDSINIISSKKTNSDKYGIYASNLGAMYGNNIRLISTDKGLGVKHEGVILSTKDIVIDSNGDISINSINAKGNLDIKGDNLKANKGETIFESQKIVNSLSADGSININISGNINIDSALQSVKENIEIKVKTLTNAGLISANKNLVIDASSIDNKVGAILKGTSLDLRADNSFINRGEIRENSEVNSFIDSKGNIKIDVTFGKFENYGNISAKEIQISVQNLLNSLNSKIIATDGNIVLTTTLGELINNGEILTDRNLSIISEKDIVINTGKIGGNNIFIQSLKGDFLNAGYITAVSKLEVIVSGLVNSGSAEDIEKYLGILQEYSFDYLKKVEDIIVTLNNKIKAGQGNQSELEEVLDYFYTLKNRLVSLKDELSKTGNLGVLAGNDIEIKSTSNILNKGLINSGNNLNIEGYDIENNGIFQGDNIFIKALGNMLNFKRIIATNDISITANSFTSMGDSMKLEEYLKLLSSFDDKKLKEIDYSIEILEIQLANEKDITKIAQLKLQLSNLYNEKLTLDNIKSKISSFENLGVLEGSNIIITTIDTLKNNGIILSKENVVLSSKEDILNNGAISSGKDLMVEAKNFMSENLSVGRKFKASIEDTFVSKDLVAESDIDIRANKLILNNKLITNASLNLVGDLQNQSDSKLQAKNSVDILGTISNEGDIIIGENLRVNTGKKNIENKGNIDIKGDTNISSNAFINSGNVTIEGSFNLKNEDIFKNTGILQSKGNMMMESKGFINENTIVAGADATIFSKDGEFISKDLSVNSNLVVNSNKILTKGDIIVGKNASFDTDNGDFNNFGNLQIHEKLSINTLSLKNTGEINSAGFDITTNGHLLNNGSIQSKGDAKIINTGTNTSITSNGELIIDGNLIVDSNSLLKNTGKIIVSESLNISAKELENGNSKIISNSVDILLQGKGNSNLGYISGNEQITVKSDGDLSLEKVQSPGDISLDISGNLINTGMIVSNKDILISANTIKNNEGTTIWAGKNIVLNAIKEIYNSLLAVIEAKGTMDLKAKSIINDAGTIKSGKDINIKTDSLINRSIIVGDVIQEGTKYFEEFVRWDDSFNYHLDFTKITIPNIVNNLIVKDKAQISSGGNISIEGLNGGVAEILNESGTILASKNLSVIGNLINKTTYKEISIDWLLENIQVELYWETKLYGTGAHGNSGITFKGNLKDALFGGYFNRNDSKFYLSLTKFQDPFLSELLSNILGPNWRSQEKPVDQSLWNTSDAFKYYGTKSNAQVLVGGNFDFKKGKLINDGGESAENQSIKVDIGDNSVDGTGSNLQVDIRDINSVKEVGNIKQIHDVEIITGSVTINGVTINAQTGNTAGSIAVAGTINPIVFIEIPNGENGIFRPATPKPGNIQPLFETNIEFIDPSKFYGTDYFFNQIGYDKNKTTTVIGDAYYEYLLIQQMIKEGIGYQGEVKADEIKKMLDNAAIIQQSLKLEVGKPLTPAQINSLDKDIIWYVEIEINGVKALTPQVYLSKDSRIELANSQGSGGSSTIKVGGDIIADTQTFVNSNGNIAANGNIIIKSQTDIENNSTGGFASGITSNSGNIALDAIENINIIGGNISGDNVLISGKSITIESTLATDTNGNQIISDKAGINAENGIQLDSTGDINIKGGTLTASGIEVLPKEKENSAEATDKEEPVEERKDTVIKDIDYYKELLKKDSQDIIAGPGGSININAGGSISIEDLYTVSSGSKYEQKDEWNYEKEIWSNAKSNASEIVGSNINVDAKENIKIKGSNLITNDIFNEDDNKEIIPPGSINIKAGSNIIIEDTQDVSYSHSEKRESATKIEVQDEKGNIYEVGDTILTIETTVKEKQASISKGSSLATGGEININAGNNLTVQGSQTIAYGNTNLEAKNDVNILDGKTTIIEKSSESIYQIFGGSFESIEKKSSNSIGSSITGVGDVNIKAGNNIKVVGSKLTSLDGDLNLNADKNISIEAGKNEYSEKSEKTSAGFFVEGSAGIGGVGVTGSGYTGDMSISGEISSEFGSGSEIMKNLDGSNEKTPTVSGKINMDQLANSEVGFKIENMKKKIDETNWTSSELSGKNINISTGEVADIGGGNYKATENINIVAKSVETTKYEDIRTENTEGFSVGIKQATGITSAIIDTVNTGIKMDEAIKSGQGNEGVLVAQGIGATTNLLFNDMIGSYSKQSINASYEKTSKEDRAENITLIDAKNISITATEGNINLNGVKVKAIDDISLDAKKEINITSAKSSSKETGIKVDLELQVEQSAGYSALWGANTDIGIGGSIDVGVTSKESLTHTDSQVKAGGNISIKSGGDTNIKGGQIEAEKDIDLNIGGNLNIESQKSYYKDTSTSANLGMTVSIGAASNTVGKGDFSFNAGGGQIWSEGETVSVSGIKSGGSLNAKVEGDLNMIGAVLGSKTGEGSLEIGGKIDMKSITTSEKQGGAQITVSGGLSGDMGVDGTIGDVKDKQITSQSAIGLNPENIKVKGDVLVDGEKGGINEINRDIEGSQKVDKDIFKKGGDISLSGSVQNIKDVRDKVNSIKSKINGKSDSISKKSDTSILEPNKGSIEKLKNESEKASIINENIGIKDTQDKLIINENKNSDSKENLSKEKENNLKEATIEKRNEKIEEVTKKDNEINLENIKKSEKEGAIDKLAQELQKVTDEVDKNVKPLEDIVMKNGQEKPIEKTEAPPLLYGNSDDYKNDSSIQKEKELNISINELIKYQEEILKSKKLSEKDKEILNEIEKQLESKVVEIKKLKDSTLKKENESIFESNLSTQDKLDRLDKNLEKLNNQKVELKNKIDRFISVNRELAKEKSKLDFLTLKYNEVSSNPKEKKKAEKLKKEIDKVTKVLESKLSPAFKDEEISLDKKIERANSEINKYSKEGAEYISSEFELSKKNFEILTLKEVQESIKKEVKDKVGLVVDGVNIKLEDTSIIQLETNSLDKISYDITRKEREEILNEIKVIEKIKGEDISKEIANSVILSSETLSKDEGLQSNIRESIDKYLSRNSELTMDILVELNRDIRVEEKGEKEIFKKENLTKDEAIFSNSLVSKKYLENFITWYNNSNDLDPLEKAALTYQRLMTYHPFEEGNGRVVRVVVNKILLENGYTSLPKFSDFLTKKVLPQATGGLDGESYTAKEFVQGFISEIKKAQDAKIETIISKENILIERKMDSEVLKKTDQEKAIDKLAQEFQNTTDEVDKNVKPLEDIVMKNGEEKPIEKTEAPPLLYGNSEVSLPEPNKSSIERFKNESEKVLITNENIVIKDVLEKKVGSYENGVKVLKEEIKKLEDKKILGIKDRLELKELSKQLTENQKSLKDAQDKLMANENKNLASKEKDNSSKETNLEKKAEKNNNNLESDIVSKKLGDIPMIYGTNDARKELVEAGEKSPNKNNTVADSYLGKLNLGADFIQLGDFAKKYLEGTLTDKDLNDIVNFSDDYYDDSHRYIDRQMSLVSSDANKELIDLMLSNKTIQENLKQIAIMQKKLMNVHDEDKINRKKLSEEFGTLTREFFFIKTKIVLEKTFERNGQVYFSLNELVMDKNKKIDFDKLKNIFDKDSSLYNTVTSNELRVILKDYMDHPNLKFLLDKQVIEIPEKTKNEIKEIISIESKKDDKADSEVLKKIDQEKAIDKLAQEFQNITDEVDRINKPFVDSANESIIKKEEAQLLYGKPDDSNSRFGRFRKTFSLKRKDTQKESTKKESAKEMDIVHQPNKSTGNLEDPFLKKAETFGESVLIYGASADDNGNLNRDELVLDAKVNEKSPIIADSFLDNFNSHHIPEESSEYMTQSLKTLVSFIEDNKDIPDYIMKELTYFKESHIEAMLTDKVEPKLNEELIREFMENKKIKDMLLEINAINNILQNNQEISQEQSDILITKVENKYAEFFAEKTMIIADKILSNGGKIYFTLDGIATENSGSQVIFNKDKLEKILFDKDFEHYDKITSKELRFLYEKHINNTNLKFLINKHVIDTSSIFSFNKIKENSKNIDEDKSLNLKKEELLSKLKDTIIKEFDIKNSEKFEEVIDISNPEIKKFYEENIYSQKLPLNSDEEKEYFEKIVIKLNEALNNKNSGYSKETGVFIRNQEEIKKQLSIIAKEKNTIPPEHLQNYLANIFLGKESKKISELKEEGKNYIKNVDEINLDFEDYMNLFSFFDKIPNKFEETRKKMDDKLVKKLGDDVNLQKIFIENKVDISNLKEVYEKSPENAIDILYSLKLTEDDVKKDLVKEIFDIIQKDRSEIFKKHTDTEYIFGKIEDIGNEDLKFAQEDRAAYVPGDKKIQIVSQEFNKLTLGEIIDALLHETQHLEQDLISEGNGSSITSEEIRELYSVNNYGYIDSDALRRGYLGRYMYENQPLEKEAFNIMRAKEVIGYIIKNIKKN